MRQITTADLLAAYPLARPIRIQRLEQSANNLPYRVDTGAGPLFLKRYQTYSDAVNLAYEHRLLGRLAHRPLSFAVPSPLPARSGETLVSRWRSGWLRPVPQNRYVNPIRACSPWG